MVASLFNGLDLKRIDLDCNVFEFSFTLSLPSR